MCTHANHCTHALCRAVQCRADCCSQTGHRSGAIGVRPLQVSHASQSRYCPLTSRRCCRSRTGRKCLRNVGASADAEGNRSSHSLGVDEGRDADDGAVEGRTRKTEKETESTGTRESKHAHVWDAARQGGARARLVHGRLSCVRDASHGARHGLLHTARRVLGPVARVNGERRPRLVTHPSRCYGNGSLGRSRRGRH